MTTPQNTLPFGNANAKGMYCPNGSSIIVSVRNLVAGATFNIKGSYITREGHCLYFGQSITPTSDGVENVYVFSIGDCILQSAAVWSDTNITIHRGQAFAHIYMKAIAEFNPGAPLHVSLAADYIETLKQVSYPGSDVQTSLRHQGFRDTIYGTNYNILNPMQATTNLWALATLGFAGFTVYEAFRYNVPDHVRIRAEMFHMMLAVTTPATAYLFMCFMDNTTLGTIDNQYPLWLVGFDDFLGANSGGFNDPNAIYDITFSINLPPIVGMLNSQGIPEYGGSFVPCRNQFPAETYLTGGMSVVLFCVADAPEAVVQPRLSNEVWLDPGASAYGVNPNNPGSITPTPPAPPGS